MCLNTVYVPHIPSLIILELEILVLVEGDINAILNLKTIQPGMDSGEESSGKVV